MTPRTRQEIARCQSVLNSDDTADHAGAVQGLEDWFCESLFEDGLLDLETILDDFERSYETRIPA